MQISNYTETKRERDNKGEEIMVEIKKGVKIERGDQSVNEGMRGLVTRKM